jgi:hypothetical protein
MKDTSTSEASLDIALKQLHGILKSLTPRRLKDLEQQLASDPASYARLLDALARLSQQALSYERYRDEVAERLAKQQELSAPKPGGLSPEVQQELNDDLNLL